MEEPRPHENRNTNTGGGNYNERIEGNYIQRSISYIYNYYESSDRQDIKDAPIQDGDTPNYDNLQCPYRGLFHFRPDDAEYFFGREVFIEELFRATQNCNFIPVLGASGSGKSSVVLAGLVPKLQQQGNWLFTHFRPSDGSDPFYALAQALVPLYKSDLDSTDEITQAGKLAQSLKDGQPLSHVFSYIQRKHPNYRVLLIADQFEEIYTSCNDNKTRSSFLDCLLRIIPSPANQFSSSTVLIATMRADFLGNALSYRPLADMLQADIKLGAMNRNELLQVIEKPALKLGVTFQDGLVERIFDDVDKEPGNLPLLEFALTELWKRRTGKQLTHAAYKEIGEVQGAIANYADKEYEKLSFTEQEQAQRIFIQLVRPGEGTEDTRRPATKAELGEKKWSSVKQLADARLVVTSQNTAGEETVELVHEALIKEWKLLREWIESDRAFRTWQEQLRGLIRQWEINRNDEGALLRGVALLKAEEWLQQRLYDISPPESEFIQNSLKVRDRLQKAEKERQQRESNLLKIITGLAISALIILGFSFWQQRQSQKSIEAVFLGTDTTEILNALPKLYTEANNFRNQVDKLKSTDDPINYYRQHEANIKRSFAYYRNILTATSRLQNKIKPIQEKYKLKKMSEEAEKSLSDMLNKYRIPQLKSELSKPHPNFGKLLPGIERTQFEKQYTEESALRMTYEILMGDSGAGADLNKDGFIQDEQEANQMPCDVLKEIERLWREATNEQCGWSGEQDFYQTNNCKQLDSTMYSLIFPAAIGEDAKNRLEVCRISPKLLNKIN